MLKLNMATAVYGGIVEAIKEVSLSVNDGKIIALLGSNGAGKSTLLKSISGVLRAEDGKITEGSIEFDGKRIDRLEPEQIARIGIRHVIQGRSVFPQLTTEENLLMGAYLKRKPQDITADLKRVYGYFPILTPLASRKSGYLSGGEQQMLVIARALMGSPQLLLLDEPSLGLAPRLIDDIFQVLKKININEQTAMLIAEQNSGASLTIADYAYVMQNGRIASHGEASSMLQSTSVKGLYLGTRQNGDIFNRHHSQMTGKISS